MFNIISYSLRISYQVFGVILIFILITQSLKNKFKYDISGIKPYVWLLFLGSLYEFFFTRMLRVPSGYWTTLYTLLEFLSLSYFFYLTLKKCKILFSVFTLLFLGVYFSSLFFWELKDHMKIEAYHLALETIFVFTYTVLWFKDLFKKPEIVPLWQNPDFYFITGNVLYFAGCIFLFLFIDVIYKSSGLISKYWILALFLGAVMRIMMIIGLLKATKKY